jgi:gliding motility-associated-like protein
MTKRLTLVLMAFVFCNITYGQLETRNWVTNIGTFSFLGPRQFNFNASINNGFLFSNSRESQPLPCVSSCDGKLLFYEKTNSLLWRSLVDSSGTSLANGDSLIGTVSGHGIISKLSRNENTYLYLSRTNLVYYSIIEKNPNTLGYEVIAKNIPLDTISGMMYVTEHANGVDKWLILTQRFFSRYKVFHVSASGVITPHSTFSHPRFYHDQGNNERLYVSADGKFVVSQNLSGLHFELLRFDPATGLLSSPIFIPPITNPNTQSPFWTRIFIFSPLATKLYVVHSPTFGMVQFDLTQWDSVAIDQSRQWISSNVSRFWDVTLAMDGSLYMMGRVGLNQAQWTSPHSLSFSRIRYPDLPYPACLFEDTTYILSGINMSNPALPSIMMPRFPMRYFYPGRFSIVTNDVCWGDTARMRLYEYDNLNSVHWNFGDPNAANNTDTVFAPVHYYSQPGTYTITAIADYCNKLDTLIKTIRVWGYPESPNLRDTVLCAGSSLPIALVPDSVLSIRWSNGDSLRSTNFSTGGWHWAELSNACFSTRDSFYITLHEPPQSGLLSDTNLCAGTSLTLTPQPGDYTWQWQDGSTQPLTVTEAGTYALLMTNACGTFVHEVRVDYQQAPELSLNDTSRCEGQFYRIELPEVWQGSYQWTDGSSERIRILTDSGWYSAEINNPCGSATDEFYLSLVDCECHMYLPTAFSPNGDGLNDELIIKTRCPLSSFQMEVYDRWGRQIFTSTNLNRGWDGTFQGQDVPNGSYPFIIRYTPEGRNPRVEKGVVSVLR